MNEDLGNPSRTCLVRGGLWEEDILIAEMEELEKLDASEICPRRLNAKEVLITPKRWRIYISCGRWFSKLTRKRLRIPRTHSETTGKSFQPEETKDDEGMNKNFLGSRRSSEKFHLSSSY